MDPSETLTYMIFTQVVSNNQEKIVSWKIVLGNTAVCVYTPVIHCYNYSKYINIWFFWAANISL